jgi:hypothetical protein
MCCHHSQVGQYTYPLCFSEIEAGSPREAAEIFAGREITNNIFENNVWFFDFVNPRYRKFGIMVVGDNLRVVERIKLRQENRSTYKEINITASKFIELLQNQERN